MNKLLLLKPTLIVGIFCLMAFTYSCKDDIVGIEGSCPVVDSTNPANQFNNTPLNQIITVTFKEKINPATIVPAVFSLTTTNNESGVVSTIGGTISFNNDSNTLSFTPDSTLTPGTAYTGRVKASVEDPLGNKMLEDYVWVFNTVPAEMFTLTVIAENGSVSKDPNQPDYVDGAQVTLTATPDNGYTFDSWSGDASGNNNPLNVAMSRSKSITAHFTEIAATKFTLTVIAENGSVSKDPNQPDYVDGAQVTLTATPDNGYTFDSWSGDASGNNNPLNVAMSRSKSITANFTQTSTTPDPINLRSSAAYGAFGGNAGITNQGINTVVNGRIGTTAASTLITGFHDGNTGDVYTETPLNIGLVTDGIFSAPPSPGNATTLLEAQNALADARLAYNSISPASKPGGIDLGTSELGGLTLEPGVYKSASGSYAISDVNLTLDGKGDQNAIWIFQSESALTVGTPTGPRSVILINGAKASNVFWYVGSAATINGAGGGTMVGTIISEAGVTFSTPGNVEQTVLNGRALSLTASVTMVNTTVNIPD